MRKYLTAVVMIAVAVLGAGLALRERSAAATATADNSAISVGAGVRYICQTSAPAPVGRARTWVRCSDGHQMFTGANNVDIDLQAGAGGAVSCLTSTGAAGTGCAIYGAAARVRAVGATTDQYSPTLGTSFQQLNGRTFPVPSDVSRVRVRINNGIWNTASQNTGAATINVGVCPSNGSYACAGGAFSGTTTGLSLPGADIDVVAPSTSTWYTVSQGTDKNVLVIFGMDTASNGSFKESFGGFSVWGKYLSGTATLNASPTWTGTDPTPELWVSLEYETSKRRIVVIGDSISKGNSSSTPPGFDAAWPNVVARDKDYGVTVIGIAGASFSTYLTYNSGPNIYTQPIFTGADCIVALGTNDFSSGVDTLKAGASQFIPYLRGAGCKAVYLLNVAPCNVSGVSTDRVYWNTYLASTDVPPFGVTKVIDIDSALDPTHANTLSSTACGGGTCDSGDACHPSTAGQLKIAQTVEAAI